MENKGTRYCLVCGKIIQGRADKRFCNDTCRSAFFNEKYRRENKEINKINRILKKNHAILLELRDNGKGECSIHDLFSKGFLFDYFTSIEITDVIIIYCYDISYQINGYKVKIY